MKINCIIIDDEPLAISVIENYLKEFNDFELVASFLNPLEAVTTLKEHEIDVVFLDKNLESLKFKGVLSKNQSIEEILSIMRSSTIDDYEIIDKTIVIK